MLLVSTVGIGDYQEVDYYLETKPNQTARTRYSPVATIALVEEVDYAIILMTDEAESVHWNDMRREIEKLGIYAEPVNIPSGRNQEEIAKLCEIIHSACSTKSEVIIDITHAFRHLPVLLLANLEYLSAGSKLELKGAYYGAFEARINNRVPVIDLKPYIELIDGSYALRQFRETGDAQRLSEQLAQLNWNHGHENALTPEFSRFTATLLNLSACLGSGLPLEAGLLAQKAEILLKPALANLSAAYFVATTMIEDIGATIRKISACKLVDNKAEIELDDHELKRQLRYIRFVYQTQAHDKVLLLLREWIVNRILYANGNAKNWLNYGSRVKTSHAIQSVVKRSQIPNANLNNDQMKLVKLWEMTKSRRNLIAHAGMSQEEIDPRRLGGSVREMINLCETFMDDDRCWDVRTTDQPYHLLLSPLGLSPGVLYTALKRINPKRALVICSEESSKTIAEICEKAEFDSNLVTPIQVINVFTCFDQAQEISNRVRAELISTSDLTINLTGGTTAMQYLVEKVGRDAWNLGVRVTRIALSDPRPIEEQRESPYRLGDLQELH